MACFWEGLEDVGGSWGFLESGGGELFWQLSRPSVWFLGEKGMRIRGVEGNFLCAYLGTEEMGDREDGTKGHEMGSKR